MTPEQIEKWRTESVGIAPTSAMTHAEIAHAIQVICDAFGDALRLAVRLQFTVQCSYTSVWVESAVPIVEIVENHRNIDPCAATRRAIVRAAAAIGEGA